ncbi:PolC-type DNA polymerase III [Enterococcus timonensis]|uniref:PolC-type DNA polymerase III n=1 Tax=Enterococcus timonensis TaxID=1852364 RepID=UPI0009F6C9F9|nr:PolC-type DNA polymerase III [Enterococcus timonensis]
MELTNGQLFTKLLEQIQLVIPTSEEVFFQEALLTKVQVHRQSQTYHFTIEVAEILPVNLFQNFKQQLELGFKDIAKVKITITPRKQQFSQELLVDYWLLAVNGEACDTPVLRETLKNATPMLENSKVKLAIDNSGMLAYIKEQYLPLIEQHYQDFGFPKFTIQPFVDEEEAQRMLALFEEQKQEKEEQLQKDAQVVFEMHQQKSAAKKEISPLKGPIQLGKEIPASEIVTSMKDIVEEEKRVTIEGVIFAIEVKELRSKRKLMTLKMTDYTSSFSVKKFSNNENDEAVFAALKENMWIKVRGSVQEDTYMRDLVVNAFDLQTVKHKERMDTFDGDKRVELHLHSNMSQMDATNPIGDYVAQAAKWGQTAIAITDHGGAQSFPDAHSAGKKHGVKILYGVEANLVDDGVPIAYNLEHLNLSDATYVVFDVETTGLSAVYDTIIELAAVKMHKGNVIDTFEQFIDPGHRLSNTTINLTGITDEMVHGSKPEKEVLQLFAEFSKDSILVAHNATFDMGFLNTSYGRHQMPEALNPVVDTLELSRFLHPQLKSHRLNTLAKKYGINLEQHHRAVFDSETTGHLAWLFLKEAQEEHGIIFHDQLNDYIGQSDAYKRARPFHAIIMAKTQAGLKNLFKLISASNIDYFFRVPRIPRSLLTELREGLLVGSACSDGEIFEAMMQKGKEEASKRAAFYDYIEIQPKAAYQPLIEQELVKNEADLEEIMENMIAIGKELNKPVVVTGDVHYLNPEDAIYRQILVGSMGGANPLNRHSLPEVYFKSTSELMKEFDFLDPATAKEIIVDNTQLVASWTDEITPVKDQLYTPKIPGSEEEITELSYVRAKELYGDPLPDIVQKRLERELKSIIGNGFSVIYLIAQKLVHKSLSDGYLVGSRGSVGSSFVATMTGITEVNPLPPHYHCIHCQYSEFFTDGSYGSGFDMPEKKCPNCGARLFKDGHDIPFETFLGFHGDKVPDIDLNFSGDYQAEAHNYTKVLFGEDYVYRAGTIGTVAEKTAYGFVKGYERDHDLQFRQAETDRLVKGATGVKRTTGQHPGGIIVIPDYMDVYDFTPIQYPADDRNAEWKTTHFDFHSIHDNILKLDILGHDDPTVIRMLQDLSGIDPKTIPTDDPTVMKIFAGSDVLGVTEEQIFSRTGTLGIPEFGTRFVRGMLEETHPSTFAELLQISGLSHGTDVWLGNAEELISKKVTTLDKVIGCRDDIMVYLMHAGLDNGLSFKIMESVRKGKGIPDEWQAEMRQQNVPEWYITSCLKIKYMFPKAHAAAYVLMALRVAYFKVYYPVLYYCAFFSVRADDFDLVAMCKGKDAVKEKMKEINDKGLEASTKEKNLLTVLEIANEMLERGFKFGMIDLYKSDAQNFVIEGDTLIAPFRAVPSLGTNVANQICEARKDGPFLSKEDLATRGKVSKTLIDYMTEQGVVSDLPDENQLSLFDF